MGPGAFQAFDRNADGVVTEQEFSTTRAERMAARAAAGAPMRGAANAPTFQDFDMNGDGRITGDEFATAHQALRGQRRGWGMGPGAGGAPGMGAGGMMQRPQFSEFDRNGDGSLSSQEFYDARAERMRQRAMQGYPMRNAASAPAFEQIDSDGDGKVTPEEFGSAQAAHGPGMPAPPPR